MHLCIQTYIVYSRERSTAKWELPGFVPDEKKKMSFKVPLTFVKTLITKSAVFNRNFLNSMSNIFNVMT